MEVGSVFATWDCFVQALEKYSKENGEVSYSVGLCNPVENANHSDSHASPFDSSLKYSYARMVCSAATTCDQDRRKQFKKKKCWNSSCSSSILVCANEERTALVNLEANLTHDHEEPSKMFMTEIQLQGTERRMASVLLRGGVFLHQVQAFLSHLREGQQNTDGLDQTSDDSQLLFSLDELMAGDPGCIVEFINFHHVPDIVYFQTHGMKEKGAVMESNVNPCLQFVTYKPVDGQFSIFGVLALNEEESDSHNILALCVTRRQENSTLRKIVESFVKHNQTLCNKAKGLVVDCDKDDADFIRVFFPRAYIAWSKEFIMSRFEKGVKDLTGDVQHCLAAFKEIMNSSTEPEYSDRLKDFFDTQNSEVSAYFLTQWDSCKWMWLPYEIDSVELSKQQAADITGEDFTNKLCQYLQPDCSFADIFTSLIHAAKSDEMGDSTGRKVEALKLNPCSIFYRSVCLPEVADAIICQAAIGESCSYNVHDAGLGGGVAIQRLDLEEGFILTQQGSRCTCEYFRDTELPCEHIFAWRSSNGLDLCDESLIPLKWQVLGEAITLDSLAESLSQGYVPSSTHHDERLKALQAVLKDILLSCSSHSYEDMGRDITLLKQILNVIKRGAVHVKGKTIAEDQDNSFESYKSCVTTNSSELPPPPPLIHRPKKRGRKSKKEKEMLAAKEKQEASSSTNGAPQVQPTTERRHNLRTNIKHKFVTRDVVLTRNTSTTNTKEDPAFNNTFKSGVSLKSSSNLEGSIVDVVDVLPSESGEKSSEDHEFQAPWSKDVDLHHVVPPTSLMEKNDNVECKTNQTKSVKRPNSPFAMVDDRKYKIVKTNDENDYSSNESDSYDDGVEFLSKKIILDENNMDPEELQSSDSKQGAYGQDLSKFLEGMSVEFLQELMKGITMLDHFDERSQNEEDSEGGQLIYPVDFVIHACHEEKENLDFIIRNLEKQLSDYNKFAYKVAASLILTAFNTGADVAEVRESIRDWPSHLPPLSSTPDDDVGPPLEADQVLTVCGYRLDRADADTLHPHAELSPRVIHAYLEVLSQRHNGKMFVIPYDVVQHWRNETFGEMIFKNVHFKTFDYLVLPIHCGAEFSSKTEAPVIDDWETVRPHWMVLVADVRARTVGVLNPRCEDKSVIAANGYMLQWRRYMQIRSVLTGEMLPAWTSRFLHCNKQTMDHTSGALAVMNVEAVISGVPPCVMTEAHITHFLHYVSVTLRDTDRETTVLCVGGLQCQEMAARDADWLQCQNCRAWWHRACCGCDNDDDDGEDNNNNDNNNNDEMSASNSNNNNNNNNNNSPTPQSNSNPNPNPNSNPNPKPFYCSPCRQRIAAVKISNRTVVLLQDAEEEEEEEEDVEDGNNEEIEEDVSEEEEEEEEAEFERRGCGRKEEEGDEEEMAVGVGGIEERVKKKRVEEDDNDMDGNGVLIQGGLGSLIP